MGCTYFQQEKILTFGYPYRIAGRKVEAASKGLHRLVTVRIIVEPYCSGIAEAYNGLSRWSGNETNFDGRALSWARDALANGTDETRPFLHT